MNASTIIADTLFLTLAPIAFVFVVLFLFGGIWASRFTKVGPNQVLIVSGRRIQLPDGTTRGFRLVKGGGTFVWPMFEKTDVLSLELFGLQLAYPKTFAADGAGLMFEAQAQLKIKSDDASLLKAAERLISSCPPGNPPAAGDLLQRIAISLFEKNLNALLAASSSEEALRNPPAFAIRWQQLAAPDFDEVGLEIVSLVVRDIQKIPSSVA